MKKLVDNKHYLYLFLAVIGGGLTLYYVLLGIVHNGGFNSVAFIKSTWTDNHYAKSLTFDFWTVTNVGLLFIIFEGLRLKMKRIWLYVILTVFVAYAFSFPLFLFFRELHLRKQKLNGVAGIN